MTTPHIHKDLIIAWADGAEIQYRTCDELHWEDIDEPHWVKSYEYRIKPQTKTVHFALYYNGSSYIFSEEVVKTNCKLANVVAATFDDQGNLLTAEKVN